MATATQSRPLTDEEYAALTRQQRIALGLDEAPEGAPADFGGTVLPNPNHVRPLPDTDSGIEPTRLPADIKFQRGNFSGKMGGDISNPARAELIAPEMQTIAAKTTGKPVSASAQVDYDALAKQHGATSASSSSSAGAVDYDALAKQHGAVASEAGEAKTDDRSLLEHLAHDPNNIPLDSYTHATERGVANLGQGAAQALEATGQLIRHPIDSITGMVKGAAALPGQIKALIEDPPDLGDVGDVAGTTAGNLIAGQAISEGAGALASRLPKTLPEITAKANAIRDAGTKTVRVGVKAGNAALEKIPGTVGGTVGAGVGGYLAGRTGAELGAAAGTIAGKELLPKIKLPGESFGLPKTVAGGEAGVPQVDIVAHPEATLERAAPEVPEPEVPAPKVTPKAVGQQLEQSLGGQKLVPGVPLRSQPAAMRAAAGQLPEGFTPVESSALKGYKYDPETREFSSVTQNGQHYIHGDVSPEEVQAFADAESKGKAWNQLRSQNPLVGKMVNGKRVASAPSKAMRSVVFDPETGKPEFSDVVAAKKVQAVPGTAKTASPGEDLTPQLQASLDQVNLSKGAVRSNVDPALLAKRWGVDMESLAAGREQTRGMSPADTEANIQKLTEAYKKGQPVTPVIETRDAANNIVSVDGRARAIAAQRAGVKRIPVIVRRMGKSVN